MSGNSIKSSALPSEISAKPLCYRLAPDRQLLEDGCGASDCKNCSVTEHGHEISGPRDIPPCLLGLQHHTTVGYDGLRRVAMMVTPECGGSFRDQAWEAVSTVRAILRQQGEPMVVTMQTVFVADADDVPSAKQLFEAYYGEEMPLTLFVVQPPCGGVGIAIEAWAISTAPSASVITVRTSSPSNTMAFAGFTPRPDRSISASGAPSSSLPKLSKRSARFSLLFTPPSAMWFACGSIRDASRKTKTVSSAIAS